MKETVIHKLLRDPVLHEAVSCREQQRPSMPADLNARLMARVNRKSNPFRRMIPWVAAASIVGVALILLTRQHKPTLPQAPEPAPIAQVSEEQLPIKEVDEPVDIVPHIVPQTKHSTTMTKVEDPVKPKETEAVETKEDFGLTPQMMDTYVAQLAEAYQVDGIEMNCDDDDTAEGIVYILPNDPETDILCRLYLLVSRFGQLPDNDLLTLSDEQFYFEMTTIVDNVESRNLWCAERNRDKIYLYRTQYTDEHIPILDCLPIKYSLTQQRL